MGNNEKPEAEKEKDTDKQKQSEMKAEPRDFNEQVDERLQVLETKVLYQDRTIEDLNEVVTQQQNQIDQLILEVKRLREVSEGSPEAGIEAGEEPPPPHY